MPPALPLASLSLDFVLVSPVSDLAPPLRGFQKRTLSQHSSSVRSSDQQPSMEQHFQANIRSRMYRKPSLDGSAKLRLCRL